MMILFIPWDIWFTSSQVWQFNPKYFLGFKLFYLPIEEWLFFLFIPFACIFIYEVLNYFFPTNSSGNFSRIAINGLALILFLFAIFNYQKQYTFVCFLLTSLFIFFLNTRNISWLFKFLRMYLVSLIPFILINGFLTGSFTDQAVVIYNSEEILGFRILNIPIEDSIYNLLMLLVVIFFYEC